MFMVSIQALKALVLVATLMLAKYDAYLAEQEAYLTPEMVQETERPAKFEIDFDNAFSPEGE